MFDATHQYNATTQTCTAALQSLGEFVGNHRDALLNSAHLLGGAPGLRLVQDALEGLQEGGILSRRTMRNLERVLELLKLENVHLKDTLEAERFAQLDPADPCVEDVCWLSDQLSGKVSAVRAAARHAPTSAGQRAAA